MRLLFVTSNRLGDAILSTGVLAHFIKAHPGIEVTVVCGKVPAPLFRATPGLKEIITVEKQAWSTHWLGAFGKLFTRRWDVMVDLRNVGIFRLLLAGKKYRGGATDFRGHKLEEFASLLGSKEVPEPVVWLDEAAKDEARQILPAAGDQQLTIALGATTGPKRKRWRPENYAAVIEALSSPSGKLKDARIVLLGAPGAKEREQADALMTLLPNSGTEERTIDLVGKTDVLNGAAVLTSCDFYLGVDSGLMHMAAALGLPTLGIFGEHGAPQTYRPWPPSGGGASRAGGHVAHVHKKNPDWTWDDRPSAMDGVKVEDVVRAAEELATRAGVLAPNLD